MFYDEVKAKILHLMKIQKNQAALELINEELKMPYIPPDFEQFLLTQQTKLQQQLNQKNAQKEEFKTWDTKTILAKLQSADLFEQSMGIMALEKINLRQILKELEKYLLRDEVPNDFKTLVLMTLYTQEINEPLKLKKGRHVFKIIPKDLKVDFLQNFFQQVTHKLIKLNYQNNLTLQDLATKTALSFLMKRFPEDFDFTSNDLTAMVLKRAALLLGEEILWDDLSQVLTFDHQKAQTLLDQEAAI